MRKRSWWVTVVLAVSLLGVPAFAAYEPPEGGLFNAPRPFGTEAERWTIVHTVERAIERAQGPTKRHPDPRITISTYLLDRLVTVDALIAACKRGISVRVILDEDIATAPSRKLIRKLNADNVPDADNDGKPDRKPRSGRCGRELRSNTSGRTSSDAYTSGSKVLRTRTQLRTSALATTANPVTWGKDGSYVKRCTGSCRGRGSGGNVHSKFFMFSRTGQAQHVVMISSSNLNKGGALLGWNDLVVMKDKRKSYEFYAKIHRLMTAEKRAGGKLVEVRDGRYISRFFPMFPAGKRKDPTLQDLKQIRCSGPMGRTQIHVSMFYWKGTRGQYLASELVNLARKGCRVSVIYGAPSIEIAQRLRELARDGVITLYDSRWDFDEDGWNEVRTHAKYVLVRGAYRNLDRTYQVWTGSQNWVSGSLNLSDESTVNITSKAIYTQYLANWGEIRDNSRRIPPP